jgi:hypothetical protein
MHTADSDTPRRRYRLRFSLFALFLLMTGACLLLSWWVQPRQCTVEAIFQVSSRPVVLLGEQTSLDAEEIRLFRRSQIGLFNSPFLIQAAIRDPAIAVLPIIATREDPVQWILDNLEVEFRDDSELLVLRMHGPEGAGDDLRLLVNALSKAYLEEVVLVDDRRRRLQRDALAKAYEDARRKLSAKTENLRSLKMELGVDDTADSAGITEDKFGFEVRQHEIDSLKDILRQVGLQLEIMDINSMAPPRVRKIQSAVVVAE